MVRRIFTINFLDSFVFGITTVMVPLLMLEKGMDLAAIGVVFSLTPIAKVAVRLASAAYADAFGERLFYFLNSLGTLLQPVAYAFSNFGIGKLLDGASDSFIWAVNRSSLMHEQPERQHFVSAGLVSGRAFYFAVGSFAVWLLFPVGGFGILLALSAIVGIVMVLHSFGVKDTPHRTHFKLSGFTFLGREMSFYETTGAMTVGSTLYTVILYLLIPLMFGLSGFSLGQIGLVYAVYFLIYGIVLNVLSSRRTSAKATACAGSAIFSAALLGMSFGGTGLLPHFFLLMAFGDACLALLWEEIIYLQAKKRKNRSTEIALLHTPGSITVFAASMVSGAAAAAYGFAPILAIGAASMVAFAVWSLRLTGNRHI